MHAVIRKYKFKPAASAEISKKINEGFIPLLYKSPGFVSYYWLDTGEGTGASVSVFKDKTGSEKCARLAADFVERNLANLVGKPEITGGKILAQA